MLVILKSVFWGWYLVVKTIPIYIKAPFLLVLDFACFLYRLIMFTPRLFIKEPDDTTYGEVSYVALSQLARFFTPNSVFVDLGSGLGKPLFFMSNWYAFKSIGIERNTSYVSFSNTLKQIFFLKDVSIEQGDLYTKPLPNGDIYLVAGTCFDDDLLLHLSNSIKNQNKDVVILSTTNPLPGFDVVYSEFLPASWGKSKLYVQKLIH